MKIKIRLDAQTRPVWETALAAKAEVASWPAWKRGCVCAGEQYISKIATCPVHGSREE